MLDLFELVSEVCKDYKTANNNTSDRWSTIQNARNSNTFSNNNNNTGRQYSSGSASSNQMIYGQSGLNGGMAGPSSTMNNDTVNNRGNRNSIDNFN